MVTAVALSLTLAFEPTKPGTMRRPPRAAHQPILTDDILWRILFVSALVVAGAFGIYFWAEGRGLVLSTRVAIAHNPSMNHQSSYRGYRFPPEIISHAVWLYHRFTLSFRDIEDLLAERGVIVTYESIRQWCMKFGPNYAIHSVISLLRVSVAGSGGARNPHILPVCSGSCAPTSPACATLATTSDAMYNWLRKRQGRLGDTWFMERR